MFKIVAGPIRQDQDFDKTIIFISLLTKFSMKNHYRRQGLNYYFHTFSTSVSLSLPWVSEQNMCMNFISISFLALYFLAELLCFHFWIDKFLRGAKVYCI